MAAPHPRRTPAFFWQGALILLPVVVLTIASFIFLRQDERTAETEARNQAAENVQSLGRALRASVAEQLRRYLDLQSAWQAGLAAAADSPAAPAFPSPALATQMKQWQADYFPLSFAQITLPPAKILADGRRVAPPDFPAVPQPPAWFRELSAKQTGLWAALRTAKNTGEIVPAQKAFLASEPSDSAAQAMTELFEPPEELIARTNSLPSETGLSFEEIACYQLLAVTNAQLTDALLQSLSYRVLRQPSFVSSKLLLLAGNLTNRASPFLQQKFLDLQTLFEQQTRVTGLLDNIPLASVESSQKKSSHALWTRDAAALAIFQSSTWTNEDFDFDNATATRSGYTVWWLPRELVTAVFSNALNENKSLIPRFATATLIVESLPLADSQSRLAGDGLLPLLGETMQSAGMDFAPEAIHFDLKFSLLSREQMLSPERRRIKLFGALIVGALFAALIGVLMARRSFYQQLRLNEQKSNFVSSVSHELRAPIASVRLMAENLERGKVSEPARQNEYFRFIVQECRRLSSLIENVLDFSRIEQGRKQYDFEPTNLAALAETTVKIMQSYAAEKNVRLAFQSTVPASAAELAIDGRALQQALVNLIDNAIKHSRKDETVAVALDLNREASLINLSVSDHGPGIPAAEHEKIFERFYRLGTELRRETQGVGIGLSVVKHIVEAHGGRVRVQSAVGQGSRFVIELPFAPIVSSINRNFQNP